MRIVGVDLAAQPERTGVVVLDLGGDRGGDGRPGGSRTVTASVPAERPDDEMLVALGGDADMVALDAPLGWPVAFVDAVSAHRDFAPWPGSVDRRPLTHRRTDDVVVEAGWGRPMSVAADRLGSVAMRAALLQREWAFRWGAPAPRDGSGRLAEVYPAAVLRVWGMDGRGHRGAAGRGPDGAARRAALVAELVRRCEPWLVVDGASVDAVAGSEHLTDALVAALGGWAVATGRTHRPVGAQDQRLARVEGWIHVPAASPEQLAPSG